jgi:hypothetical protein
MSLEASEAEVLRGLMPQLEAEGYQVYLHPRPPLTPDFLGNFQPDAIAIRNDKNLLIEIISETHHTTDELNRLRNLIKDQPNWELRVILLTPITVSETLPIQSSEAIRHRIAEMEELVRAGHIGSAFLLGWASFEAAGRALLTEQFRKPQTPGRLVDVLAGDGYLTPSEADRLRALAKKRNAFIHGEFGADITAADVVQIIGVLKTLLGMVESA